MNMMTLSSLAVFIFSLCAYLTGLLGKTFPPFLLLHVAVFAVAAPIVWVAKRRQVDFTNAPVWARVVVIALSINALTGFWGPKKEEGVIATVNGQLVRVNRGRIIKEATTEQRITEEAASLKTAAGLWMLFSFGAMIFYRYGENEDD